MIKYTLEKVNGLKILIFNICNINYIDYSSLNEVLIISFLNGNKLFFESKDYKPTEIYNFYNYLQNIILTLN